MSQTTDMRDAYLAAELDLLRYGKASAFGDRSLTTADLPEIIAGRKEWEARAAAEARGGLSIRTMVVRS
jgi:hypothetical protein